MKFSKVSTHFYLFLTKFDISQSVFHQFTCSLAVFKEVIKGYRRPVWTGLNRSKQTGLLQSFIFQKWKTRTAVQSFCSPKTGLSSTSCFTTNYRLHLKCFLRSLWLEHLSFAPRFPRELQIELLQVGHRGPSLFKGVQTKTHTKPFFHFLQLVQVFKTCYLAKYNYISRLPFGKTCKKAERQKKVSL
jgi:hypothetical protein